MSDALEFRITLKDLRPLSDAVCDLDSCKPRRDARFVERVSAGHAAIIRTLGAQVGLIYALDDGAPEAPQAQEVPA